MSFKKRFYCKNSSVFLCPDCFSLSRPGFPVPARFTVFLNSVAFSSAHFFRFLTVRSFSSGTAGAYPPIFPGSTGKNRPFCGCRAGIMRSFGAGRIFFLFTVRKRRFSAPGKRRPGNKFGFALKKHRGQKPGICASPRHDDGLFLRRSVKFLRPKTQKQGFLRGNTDFPVRFDTGIFPPGAGKGKNRALFPQKPAFSPASVKT